MRGGAGGVVVGQVRGKVIMRSSDLDHQLFALVGRGVVVWQVRGEVRTDFDHLYAFGGEGGGVVLWPVHGEVRRTDLDPWLEFGGGGGWGGGVVW